MRRIGGIVLAAGGSTRLGEPKQLVQLAGEPLARAAVRAAQDGGCDVVCVVTGHARIAVENAVADLSPVLAHNEDWQRGPGSSIRVGLSALPSVSAVVFLACDQPAVNGEIVRALIERHDQTGRAIVASEYAGTMGIPALFDRSCFAELRGLSDEVGAKAVIRADPARVASVEFPDGAFDLDSSEDLRAWRKRVQEPTSSDVRSTL